MPMAFATMWTNALVRWMNAGFAMGRGQSAWVAPTRKPAISIRQHQLTTGVAHFRNCTMTAKGNLCLKAYVARGLHLTY